ncbi:hypothetical protein L3V83_11325 [Thiotrichales bacterium 19X7-9]|nr:hypothetical protein [Thiotrichales bacterium 19X7-9]UTW43654.1 hypothetical protein KFE69_06070 [bacterium SCSIO 12844]
MSKTYYLLNKFLPKSLANIFVVLWFSFIILTILDRSLIAFHGFIYWEA